MQNFGHTFFIAFGVTVEGAVKPAEETGLPVMLAFVQRFKQGGAQGRGEDHRHQNGKHHRRHNGNRELTVDGPGSPAKEGHRYEDG